MGTAGGFGRQRKFRETVHGPVQFAVTRYSYNGDGNISSLETKAGKNVRLSFAYQYDGNGNSKCKYTGRRSFWRNGALVSYAYDKAGNQMKRIWSITLQLLTTHFFTEILSLERLKQHLRIWKQGLINFYLMYKNVTKDLLENKIREFFGA